MIEVMFLASQCLACPQDCTVSVPRFVPKQMPAQMGVLTDPNVHFFLAANLLRKGEYAAAKLAYEVALEYGYEAPGSAITGSLISLCGKIGRVKPISC